MLKRGFFLVLAVLLGIFSLGGLSYGLNPASANDSVALNLGMLVVTISLTVLFAWLTFKKDKPPQV